MKKLSGFFLISILTLNLFAGTIKGKVTLGSEKSTIAGVSVRILDQKVRFGTDANGVFIIPNLTKFNYRLEVMQLGYKKGIIDNVTVDDDDTTFVEINLAESPFQLNEVVVTGSLNKHLLKDSPVVTEVISRREIEKTGSSDLSEVIKAQTGIELGTSIGQTQNVRLQGLNKNQVLVLVDGERVTGRVDDAVDLGQIPVNMIEKIEVVKGPLSSTYGSDALGGVVNIITKNPKNAPQFHISADGGSNGKQDYEISGAQTFENFLGDSNDISFLVNAGLNKYFGVSHYDTSYSFDGVPEYDRRNADLKIGFSDHQNLQLDVKLGYYNDYMIWQASKVDYYQVQTKATNDKVTASASANYTISDESNVKLSALFSQNDHGSEKISNTKVRSDINVSVEELHTYRGQYTFVPYSSSVLTFGLERNIEDAKSGRLKSGARTIINDVGYMEDEWSFLNYTLSFGGRYSDNSVFGGFFAPRVSLRYKANEKLTFRGSYGRGYRAPSFIELFFDFNHSGLSYIVEGDPTLQPETSHGFNFGVDYARDNLIWFRANFYYNNVTNLIEDFIKHNATTAEPVTIFSYKNIAEAVTKGVDVDIDMAPFTYCALAIGYNYTSAVDGNGIELPFRTPHSVTLKTSYENHEQGTTVSIRGRWYDMKIVNDRRQNNNTLTGQVTESIVSSPAYHVFDIKASQIIYDIVTLSAGINNILDRTVFPYGNIKGREYFAGIRLQFQ
jgi:outer membrane receptor for ferrienterochelin and colicins